MKNKDFESFEEQAKRTKLARALKSKSHTKLSDEQLIEAVNQIDLSKQYFIKVCDPETFEASAKDSERIIKQTKTWTKKVVSKATVLIQAENGGICVLEEQNIGSLDLNKKERNYSILVF